MNRAVSILTVKRASSANGVYKLAGTASTPTPDRTGDIVDPMGARFKLPLPLLWQHDHQKPVGQVKSLTPGPGGINFEAEIPKVDVPGNLKNRVDEAVHSLENALVSAVSIGFKALDFDVIETGYFFKVWEFLELSLVTIPANSEASVRLIKHFDQQRHITSAKRREPLSNRKPIYLNTDVEVY